MPNQKVRDQALDEFRRALADVVDWDGAQVEDSTILMHT
jgi:hypothetical protein